LTGISTRPVVPPPNRLCIPSVEQLVAFPGWTRFPADRLGKVSHFERVMVALALDHLRSP
jgi:hypothetical protein